MKPQRSPIYTYTVDIRAMYRVFGRCEWVFALGVWKHTDMGRGGIPAARLSRMEFTGTQDDVRDAAQTFLDLVKIKDETL